MGPTGLGQPTRNPVELVEKNGIVNKPPSCLTRLESGAHYSQEYGRDFKPKLVEMHSIGTLQPHQPNRFRLKRLFPNDRTQPNLRSTDLLIHQSNAYRLQFGKLSYKRTRAVVFMTTLNR